MREVSDSFVELIDSSSSITVLSHINPDADAIGSSLALYTWLRDRGHRVEIANISTDIPRYLKFLPNYKKIKNKIDYTDSLIISCDCGSIDRLGFEVDDREIINIDHHETNTSFGRLNIVTTTAVSTTEVLFNLLHPLGGVTSDISTALYTGLISDSRNFTTSNMPTDIFLLANTLVELGADPVSISNQMINSRSLASIRVLSLALSSLELSSNGKLAIMTIDREDLEKSGAIYSDLDGVVDYAKSLHTVKIGFLLIEREDNIKVSIRSKNIDISSLASHFGGGGHRYAGGFSMKGISVVESKELIIDEINSKGLL